MKSEDMAFDVPKISTHFRQQNCTPSVRVRTGPNICILSQIKKLHPAFNNGGDAHVTHFFNHHTRTGLGEIKIAKGGSLRLTYLCVRIQHAENCQCLPLPPAREVTVRVDPSPAVQVYLNPCPWRGYQGKIDGKLIPPYRIKSLIRL